MRTVMNGKLTALSLLAFAPAGASAQPVPSHTDHVVIVFDASGSMCEGMGGGQKLAAAKQALKTVKQHIAGTTAIGLLVFNQDDANRWTYPLGPRDDLRLNRAIDGIGCGGGTPLGEYMKIGADRLLAEREKRLGYGSYRLLVVTDGEATDENRMEQFTPEVKARGLTLDVIGVAMSGDHTLAKYAHSYRKVDDPASLERAIREVLAERVDPNDQTGGGDAFELVAGLDPGVASQMLVALGRTGNHPIGTQPPAPASEDRGGSGATSVPLPPSSAAPVSGCSGCVSAGGANVGAGALLIMGMLWVAIALMRRRQVACVRIARRN